MKVSADKLAQELGRQVYPIYVISGDDPLLVSEAGDLIRDQLRERGYLQRELFHVEPRFDWSEVLFNANSMSLFAEQKILEVRLNSGKVGDGATVLAQYAAEPPADTVLLLVMARLDANAQKTKWFKTLEAAALVVQVWPIEARAFPSWLENRCRRQGLRISREAVTLLAERTEGNLLAAVQEIELLKLSAVDGMIDADLVLGGVADSSRFDVFTLIDAGLAGETARALRIVDSLQAEGEPLVMLNTMIGRELRALAQMAREPSADAAMRKFRVWGKRQGAVKRALSRADARHFEQLLRLSGDIDGMVKGFHPGDPWEGLRNVMLGLAMAPASLPAGYLSGTSHE